MKRQVYTGVRHGVAGVLASALVACGGASSKPSRQPADALPGVVQPASSGSNDSTSGSGVASTSDDVTKGVGAIKAGDWTRARASFESAIVKNPKHAEAHYYLGLVMEKTGDKAAAQQSYHVALSLQPDLQEAAENLTALLIEDKKFDDAILLSRKALTRNAKNADMQLNLAVALSGNGKGDVNAIDAATKAFEDALKLSPNDARFYLAYAQHLSAAKKGDQATAQLLQAQRVAGEDPTLLGTIGFELRTARAPAECIQVFDKAIALNDNADFRTNRALCKYALKDKTAAIADLTIATKREPTFAPAHYWLGSWMHEDGRFPEALTEYTAYLANAPKGPMARAAEAKAKLAREKKKPEKASLRK